MQRFRGDQDRPGHALDAHHRAHGHTRQHPRILRHADDRRVVGHAVAALGPAVDLSDLAGEDLPDGVDGDLRLLAQLQGEDIRFVYGERDVHALILGERQQCGVVRGRRGLGIAGTGRAGHAGRPIRLAAVGIGIRGGAVAGGVGFAVGGACFFILDAGHRAAKGRADGAGLVDVQQLEQRFLRLPALL